MALLPHGFFPRSMMDMDSWLLPTHSGHSTMDLFDPFDELDHIISRNLNWLNKPEFLQLNPLVPKVPHKYRITVDVVGYNPNSIKTEIKGNKLVVYAREEEKHEGEDFSIKEFKKTYELPVNAEWDKLVSFVTHGQLVIEVPLKEESNQLTDVFPKIVDTKDGKTVSLNFNVPNSIDPSKISVHIKDRDLIVKAEDKVEKPDGISKFYYYKRTTMPENTDFEHLKLYYDNHNIDVSAPLLADHHLKWHKKIPIEYKKPQDTTTKTPQQPIKN